jgi:hypothetical protein
MHCDLLRSRDFGVCCCREDVVVEKEFAALRILFAVACATNFVRFLLRRLVSTRVSTKCDGSDACL